MRIFQFLAIFILSTNFAIAQNMEADDDPIYSATLKAILNQEKSEKFIVWNQTIDGKTLLVSRVPRHVPDQQFVESLPGLPLILQQRLQKEPRASLRRFDSRVNFVDTKSLYSDDAQMSAIGFSKIVYDQKHNALLYAEICTANADAVCNGYGFWFVKTDGRWKLNKKRCLWGGYSPTSWSAEIAK
ncbi:hypothetical protein GTP23_00450 [Pseudoduganella sp. FT93W]|uniref:Nuclear transport factor 2 family protein n=1 Tax=Duganella fentianensis TaxID=2692177 RepID=A0A845HQ03_9BURK|nr:hypothetical protein [Duganella fentianensis]MYN43534.1 hypothetical protein [Duganella fentianensis]